MADAPSAPWKLKCPWCTWFAVVNARGARRGDPGSGVEAAEAAEEHAREWHGKSWREFVHELDRAEA